MSAGGISCYCQGLVRRPWGLLFCSFEFPEPTLRYRKTLCALTLTPGVHAGWVPSLSELHLARSAGGALHVPCFWRARRHRGWY